MFVNLDKLNVTEKNGNLVAVKVAEVDKDIVIMTNAGVTIKLPVDQVSLLGRVTQGLRLISLRDNQFVATISIVDKTNEEEKETIEAENKEEVNNESSNESSENDKIE